MVNKYYERMHDMFHDVLPRNRYPFPTTCVHRMIENPEQYGFKHKQFFVVTEANFAWNLSSDIFTNTTELLRCTFFGKLAGHVTSCSIWEECSGGGVTTLCPGLGALMCWGTSGGSPHLRAVGRARDVLIGNYITNYFQAHERLPTTIPGGFNVNNYVCTNRRGGYLGLNEVAEDVI